MRLPFLALSLLAAAACSQGSYVPLPAGPTGDGAAASQDGTTADSPTGDAEPEGGEDASTDAGADGRSDAAPDAPRDAPIDSASPKDGGDEGG